MGESIAEVTVSKWLKAVGDLVERDEPILEISTDKVDAEIPAPHSGRLVEVVVVEGETVEVGMTLGFIETEVAAAKEAASAPAPASAAPSTAAPASGARVSAGEAVTVPQPPQSTPTSSDASPRDAAGHRISESASNGDDGAPSRITPLVRRMAEEHGIDLTLLEGKGSGHGGRITKQDLLDHLEGGVAPQVAKSEPTAPVAATSPAVPSPAATPPSHLSASARPRGSAGESPSDLWRSFNSEVQHPEFPVRTGDSIEPMDKIRRLTAEHMVLAKRLAPHVHSFIEIDFTRIDHLRKVNSTRWKEQGARVSFTAFVVWAVSRVLREYPILNSVASGNSVITRGHVNIGIAVDLDPGLIVPVIRDADHLSLVGIGTRITDLAERARSRKLNPDEVQGATFSITNPGVLGTLVGLPIIPKGTSGILGTGSIEKGVIVLTDPATGEDTMGIRKRSIFSLGYDHRIVDGADAARFLARVRDVMQEFPDDA
jgi:2-oxoglutarate dehydrogenase E2 component (dihydrolipoamide succinyltransferase)